MKPQLTPETSRLARQELGGLSQTAFSKASGVQAYIVKQWEAGRFRPPSAALQKLRDFYEAEGVNFADLEAHVQATQPNAPSHGATGPAGLQAGFTYTPRPGFFLSDELPPEVVGSLMERMEANDDRIAELTGEAFKSGFFGGLSDDTEEKARELIGTLAENHVIFRVLQGRNIVSTARDEPKTLGDYLAKMLQGSPVLPLVTAQSASGKGKGKAAAPSATVASSEEA